MTNHHFPSGGNLTVYDTNTWWYYDEKRNEIIRSDSKESIQAWWGIQVGLFDHPQSRFGSGQDCFSDENVREINYSWDRKLVFVSFLDSDDIEMFFASNRLLTIAAAAKLEKNDPSKSK